VDDGEGAGSIILAERMCSIVYLAISILHPSNATIRKRRAPLADATDCTYANMGRYRTTQNSRVKITTLYTSFSYSALAPSAAPPPRWP
jgi:hypothetical protein